MKVSWNERAKAVSTPSIIKSQFNNYHYACAEAIIHFINHWVLTYDPRLKIDKTLPFELFPKQEEFIHWMWERYITDTSGVVDKCRTAGASWLTMAFYVYMLLFVKDCSLQIYTFKSEACHKLGDISSLMEKAIFIINRLPPLFTVGVKCNHMYISNPRMTSDIAGSSGDNPGRSSRRTMIARDEEAFYENAESIEAALSETSNCQISISTHKSTNTLFYQKCKSSMARFIFDWWDDPRNNQEWYDRKRQEAEEKGILHIFEREINRNAGASVDAVVCPSAWVATAVRTEIDVTGKKIASLDPANMGGDTHGYVAMDGNELIHAEESGEGDPGDATDKYFWKTIDLGCEEFRYEPNGIGVGVAQRLKEIQISITAEKSDLGVEIAKTENENERGLLQSRIDRIDRALNIKITAWNPGGAVLRPNEIDFAEKKNSEFFKNAKAQAWWKVREEFLNTFRSSNNKKHKPDFVIKFPKKTTPKIEKLINELSQPQFILDNRGKLLIDKKPKGTKSPNLGDAYMMCRAETEVEWQSWTAI